MGELPDWYRTRAAAQGIGVPPWELVNMPLIWQEWELTAQHAETVAERERQRQRERKHRAKK